MKNAYDLLVQKLSNWFDGFILLLPNIVVAIIIFVLVLVF